MSHHHPHTADAVLALDIGGTKLAAGVVTADGTTLAFAQCPSAVRDGPRAVLKRLFDLGRAVLGTAGAAPGDLRGTGIGCGGPLDSTAGVLLAPPHLPGWKDVPIVRLAEDAHGLPAVLDNDGTAGAAGEWRFGAGRGTRHLVYLTVSTGIGGGMVFDGRTYRGAAGNGGEPGHLTVRSDGHRPCRSCGRTGCLEAYASGTSIAERARAAVAEARAHGVATALADRDPLTAADVTAAVRAGDGVATAVWEETLDALGTGLVSLVNVFEPELVVLGGGVTRAGELLMEPLRRRVAERAMGPAAATVRLTTAAGGDQAGVLGAAAIAFERLPPR
ncbi:ROK family protein [Streptomyces radicis]|uniref:ROK family protein n=1 Tax=Streptomyces radicis TaxID=1750517 RepID=A0A3A9VUE6_9ACTN|nr:ROK family protein [Streptomyces radicis]RKN04528.1 ROK family protein [Streptomyces radicis]RKN15506.1 ROK family protein [Streptomyces radicis]